jgi:hypothetical protein
LSACCRQWWVCSSLGPRFSGSRLHLKVLSASPKLDFEIWAHRGRVQLCSRNPAITLLPAYRQPPPHCALLYACQKSVLGDGYIQVIASRYVGEPCVRRLLPSLRRVSSRFLTRRVHFNAPHVPSTRPSSRLVTVTARHANHVSHNRHRTAVQSNED